ncbi:hypothetical protein SUGI_0275720 [Cryptomeria japonica]|nr:hypothetical protein SUGI_0275720 [Cryptomeria japonica]
MAGKINIGVTSLPPDDKCTNIPNLLQALDNMAPSVIKSLIEEINKREEEHKITGIIVDARTCFGLKVVANFYKIPLFAFHASLIANCAIRYFIPRLISLGTLAQDGAPKEEK